MVEVKQKNAVKLIKFFNPSKRKARALYVARLDRISRPPALKRTIDSFWQNVISQDLCRHMQNINNKILAHACNGTVSTRDSILMPELILTGQGSANPTCDLSLSPNIWLRCGSSRVKDWAEKEVGHMCWTREYGLGNKIHVGLRAAVPASDPGFPVPPGLPLDSRGFDLPGDFTLFLHVERPTTASAPQPSGCGLICFITVKRGDKIVYNGCSRIGGILSIKEASGAVKLVGVTSGHALIDEFLSTNMETLDSQSRRRSGRIRSLLRLRDRHGATASPSPGSIEPPAPTPPVNAQSKPVTFSGTPSATAPGENFGTERIQQGEWDPVQSIYSLNWLGGGWETVKAFRPPFPVSRPEMLSPSSDFALLELPKDVANTFSLDNGPAKRVESLLPEKDMHEGELHIVLGPGEVVPGILLFERPSIFLRGQLFPTRKIQVERPLNLGVSGCWVIQRGGLCGMIAMIYEDEPYAYMITAEKLISDIEKTLGDKSKVSLPPDMPVRTLPPDTAVYTLPTTVSPTVEDDDELARLRALIQEPDPLTLIVTSPKRFVASYPITYHLVPGQLTAELTRALIQSPMDETKYFLPLGELDKILDFIIVRMCLKHLLPQRGDIQEIATYASGRGNKIFAILLLIEKPEHIIHFYLKKVINHDLPLKRTNENGADFRLVRENDLGDVQRGVDSANTGLFDEWKSSEIRQFDDCQWYMIAPCIDISHHEANLSYVYFHERTIFPFTRYDPCLGSVHSPNVYKARIHPAHHNLSRSTETDEFIIEVLDRRQVPLDRGNPAYYLSEIPPLVALDFQGGYYLVLSWADGGNLYDLWATSSVPEAPYSRTQIEDWVLDQCLGLAEGLAAIHTKKPSRNSKSLAGPKITVKPSSEREKAVTKEPTRYRQHSDLKPENILWFRSKMPHRSIVETELRILDVKSTALQLPDQAAVAEPTPYSAPDFDMEPTTSNASDIWALGCVYLELITWFLLGHEAVGEFSRARMQDGADKSTHDKTFFTQSCQYEGGLATSLKTAVTNWFQTLRSNPNCTGDLARILKYTEDKMLVVEADRRSSAVAVANFLQWRQHVGTTTSYGDTSVGGTSSHSRNDILGPPPSSPTQRVHHGIPSPPQTVSSVSRSSSVVHMKHRMSLRREIRHPEGPHPHPPPSEAS